MRNRLAKAAATQGCAKAAADSEAFTSGGRSPASANWKSAAPSRAARAVPRAARSRVSPRGAARAAASKSSTSTRWSGASKARAARATKNRPTSLPPQLPSFVDKAAAAPSSSHRSRRAAAAAGALINEMVPQMRPAGSGPMSDADLELFKASAPSIAAKPGGNALIVKTMQAIAQYELKFAEIHQQFASGIIKEIPERDRRIAALADPMAGVIDWMVENGVIEESQRPQNSISVSDEELRIFNEPTV